MAAAADGDAAARGGSSSSGAAAPPPPPSPLPPRVLSVQSHVVSGYVGNKCAALPLQLLGFDVDAVMSCQLSNHTGYPSFRGKAFDGAHLDELVAGLAANGLVRHTHLLTGYIGTASMLEAVAGAARALRAANPELTYGAPPRSFRLCARLPARSRFTVRCGTSATHARWPQGRALGPSRSHKHNLNCATLPPPLPRHQSATRCSATRGAATSARSWSRRTGERMLLQPPSSSHMCAHCTCTHQ